MSKLKVLLVVYAFPPAGGVGTLRAASLARYFPGQEIQLDVLTTRNPSSVGMDHSLLDDIPPEVTIHRTFTLDLPFAQSRKPFSPTAPVSLSLTRTVSMNIIYLMNKARGFHVQSF